MGVGSGIRISIPVPPRLCAQIAGPCAFAVALAFAVRLSANAAAANKVFILPFLLTLTWRLSKLRSIVTLRGMAEISSAPPVFRPLFGHSTTCDTGVGPIP